MHYDNEFILLLKWNSISSVVYSLLTLQLLIISLMFQDQRISRISEDEPSHENPFSETPNTLCKLKYSL